MSTTADPPPGLTVTPHQLFEAARVLDRIGSGVLAPVDGRLVLLVDRAGGGRADMALELDPAGQIVGRWLLHRTEEGDETEGPLDPAELLAMRQGALLAAGCSCSPGLPDDDGESCVHCGRQLLAQAA